MIGTWWSDAIGMAGTGLVVLAYFALQLERLPATSFAYNGMNLLGATLLLTSLMFTFNLASFVIELFWIAASLIGIYKYFRRPRPSSHETNSQTEVGQ